MSTLFYAVSGEGRGHAARACTLIEDLRDDHRIVLYAPDLAYDMLEPHYRGTEIEVRQIPGLRFHYSADRRLQYLKTGWESLGYITGLPRLLARLERDFEADEPDLVLTDFEPSLPRVAQRCGVPFVSLDHQHFLVTYDLGSLPFYLRSYAALMALFVRAYFQGQTHSIVSSFYFPRLKAGLKRVTQIGVLLRREIIWARPESGSHLLAYLRRQPPAPVLDALAGCGCEVRVYGMGERSRQGRLSFHRASLQGFAEDLASSRALITTAGNQLLGEALYLGKPVLAMPEPGNREQEINAHFLDRSGAGMAMSMKELTGSTIRKFLDGAGSLRPRVDRNVLCGNPEALRIIRQHLAAPSQIQAATAA